MEVTRIGLDIAKNVFQVHGVDAQGKVVVRKQLRRSKVLVYFAQLPACRIGIAACGSAHYWGRELQQLGHDVRLRAVQLIKPYRTKQKNDRNDAEAIGEAVSRPQMFQNESLPTLHILIATESLTATTRQETTAPYFPRTSVTLTQSRPALSHAGRAVAVIRRLL